MSDRTPDLDELKAFHERRLPPAAMLRVDRRLAADPASRAALAEIARAGSKARAPVQAVVAAGAHLSFEQLQAHVDGRLAAAERETADAHAALCAMCKRELDDLATHAAALRAPLRPATTATGEASGLARWLPAWLRLGPSLTVAGLVGALALGVVMQERGGSDGNPGAELRSTPVETATGAMLQHHALDSLDTLSSDAALAWRERDHARLLTVLRPLVDQRQPQAMAAMASLYALGLGVPQDLRMAEQLWQRAADLGHAESRDNLLVLRRQQPAPAKP